MFSCRRSSSLLRLGAILAFLSYLLAGAGFLLPASAAGARCPHASKFPTVIPDVSRTFSVHKHHCPHNEAKETTSKIILCPDGCCLLHPGQGMVTATAKFLASHSSIFILWQALDSLAEEIDPLPRQLSFPPPHHPPSFIA